MGGETSPIEPSNSSGLSSQQYEATGSTSTPDVKMVNLWDVYENGEENLSFLPQNAHMHVCRKQKIQSY